MGGVQMDGLENLAWGVWMGIMEYRNNVIFSRRSRWMLGLTLVFVLVVFFGKIGVGDICE